MDIFIKDPVDAEYFWIVSDKRLVLKAVPRPFYEDRMQIKFDGCKFWVLPDYEGYLECHYGDWRTPVKEWKSNTSDLNVKKIFDKNKMVEE